MKVLGVILRWVGVVLLAALGLELSSLVFVSCDKGPMPSLPPTDLFEEVQW